MTEGELADTLATLHKNAGPDQKVLTVHLFGLIYADEIEACDRGAPARIVEKARLGTYHVEIGKMLRLARHVAVDERTRRRYRP